MRFYYFYDFRHCNSPSCLQIICLLALITVSLAALQTLVERNYNDGQGNFVSSSRRAMARPDLQVHQVAKRSEIGTIYNNDGVAYQHYIVKREPEVVKFVERNYGDGNGNFVSSSRMAMVRPDLQVFQSDSVLELELNEK
jgi:hypothetical protein